jgi:prepilin-type N-terminal cleavage/methylation domain-containing protein
MACEGVKTMKRNQGFTIIELSIVIAIVAIIAAVAIPSFLKQRSDAQLRGVVRNFIGDFNLAKGRAVRDNSFVVILVEEHGYSIFADNGLSPGDWVRNADEPLITSRALPGDVRIQIPTSLDPPRNRTRLNSRGLPDPATLAGPGGTGEIVISNSKGEQKKITINGLGFAEES